MPFTFKQFHVEDDQCGMRVSTDGVVLGAWANLAQAKTILDIGSGSGLLSLMAAQRTDTQTHITAVELDDTAVLQSQSNINASPWPQKITVFSHDIQSFSLKKALANHFEHIVCNPPFFNTGPQTQTVARATARHTDSLNFTELLTAITRLLHQNGTASLILPIESLPHFTDCLASTELSVAEQVMLSSVENKPARRVLIALQHSSFCRPLTTSSWYIQDTQGQYSEQMVKLCRDFYLKL